MAFAAPTQSGLPTTPIYDGWYFPLTGTYQWYDVAFWEATKPVNVYLGEPPASWETLEFRDRAFRLMRRAWHRRRGTFGF